MKINFNKKIYKKEAIEEAIRNYKDLAKFNLKSRGNYFSLEIKDIDPQIEPLFKDEFSNFVLASMKQ